MKNLLIGGVGLIASVTVASAAEFYVVQESAAKTCSVMDQRPTNTTLMMVVGNAYNTRAEAESAMKTASGCAMGARAEAGAPVTHAATNSSMATNAATDMRVLSRAPDSSMSVKDYYDQNIHDASGSKIGAINDILFDNTSKVSALVVGVGGFLGMGEKYVLVPFNQVKMTMKDNKPWLTMNVTKDELKTAPGFKADTARRTWVLSEREPIRN